MYSWTVYNMSIWFMYTTYKCSCSFPLWFITGYWISIPVLWWLRWLRLRLQCGRPGFSPWVGQIPWRRERLPTPVFWPGEFHGQRSLAGYSPWGLKELEMTERLWLSLYGRTLLFIHSKYHSLHRLIPDSQSTPPLAHSLLATTSLFMSVSLFLSLDRFICVIF